MTIQPNGAVPAAVAPVEGHAPEQTDTPACPASQGTVHCSGGADVGPAVMSLDLAAQLEALLFVAPSPTPINRFAQLLEVDEAAVQAALAELAERYGADRRGLRIVRKGDRANLTTAPEAASLIEKFLGLDLNTRLSAAALETLAVIAYRQPLTRGDIEAIRGVNCDGVLRTLAARELVEPVGRLEQPGRPFLYGTTLQFLQYFGLEGLDRLPPLPVPEALDTPKV